MEITQSFDPFVKVTHLMTRDISPLSTEDTLRHAAQQMLDLGCGALPVTRDDGQCVGMLSRGDLTKVFLAEDRELAQFLDCETSSRVRFLSFIETCDDKRVREVMSNEVITLDSNDTLFTACRRMAANLFHHLPVVDEQHKVLGIVSSFDIIRHLAAQDVHL